MEESKLRDTYTLNVPGIKEGFETPKWRLAFSKSRKEIEVMAEGYSGYLNKFARAERNALPLRRLPTQDSERVYKLGRGEIIKIIGRQAEKSQEGIYEGYWYLSLTEDGTRGYFFDQFFTVFEKGSPDEFAYVSEVSEEEDLFLSRIYRPKAVGDMIQERRVDLSRINRTYGLFPDPEKQVIRIVSAQGTQEFNYTALNIPSPGRIVFEGTLLNISILSEDLIQADYSINGKALSEQYVYLSRELSEILAEEQERRAGLYQELRERGDRLESNAYGILSLTEQGAFAWDGYQRLIPAIMPQDLGRTGRVSFLHFLSPGLAGKYTGALTFLFDGRPSSPATFLYEITEAGVRLVFVPQSQIEEGVVISDTASPFVLFFNYTQ